jgi:hypothetical protein
MGRLERVLRLCQLPVQTPQLRNVSGARETDAVLVQALSGGEEDRQELRFAAVMTGGVSLAVWRGGAAHELNRVVRGGPGAYRQLLDLTGTRARVDVIAGTSAGGI